MKYSVLDTIPTANHTPQHSLQFETTATCLGIRRHSLQPHRSLKLTSSLHQTGPEARTNIYTAASAHCLVDNVVHSFKRKTRHSRALQSFCPDTDICNYLPVHIFMSSSI